MTQRPYVIDPMISAKEIAARKCAALDRQIDALVYELYGLSPDEIALVEGHA